MQIRPDSLIFASILDTYLNYTTQTANIAISGTVGANSSLNFSTTIQLERVNTRNDIYLQNLNTGVKRPIENGIRLAPYQNAGAEYCEARANFYTPDITDNPSNALFISLFIVNNTGSPITLINQTIQATVVSYRIPI